MREYYIEYDHDVGIVYLMHRQCNSGIPIDDYDLEDVNRIAGGHSCQGVDGEVW